MTGTDFILAFAILAVIGLVIWIAAREPKEKPKPAPIQLYDEAVIGVDNKPWSPTRGSYVFAVADLPEPYRELEDLPGAAGGLVTVFAEDEDDARRSLTAFLERKYMREKNAAAVAPVTASAKSFKPLIRRKKDRANGR